MGKYKAKHDCANDGTCGQSIQNRKIDSTDISFFDNSRNLIAKIPTLPKYSSDKYGNRLYKEVESKQFDYPPMNIYDVLPNSFIVKHGHIDCTIKYDLLSKQEQNQIEKDIKTSYEAFKEKFCLKNSNVDYDITVYIFNNRNDYTKYNDLLGINKDGGPGYITRGVTDCRNILTYKQNAMDFVLGHELGHIFQLRFSPSEEVRDLYHSDTEFIANFVGLEVEEKNHQAIYEQKQNCKKVFQFEYKGTTYKLQHDYLSGEEKDQIIKDIKNSHESLINEYYRLQKILPNKNATVFIVVDKDNEVNSVYYADPDGRSYKQFKWVISRSKPEEEPENQEKQEESNEVGSQSDSSGQGGFFSNFIFRECSINCVKPKRKVIN